MTKRYNLEKHSFVYYPDFPFDKAGRPYHYQYYTLLPNYHGIMSVSTHTVAFQFWYYWCQRNFNTRAGKFWTNALTQFDIIAKYWNSCFDYTQHSNFDITGVTCFFDAVKYWRLIQFCTVIFWLNPVLKHCSDILNQIQYFTVMYWTWI